MTSGIDHLRRQVFSHGSDDLEDIWSRQPGLTQFLDDQAEADKPVVLYAEVCDSEDRSIGCGRLQVWTILVPQSTLASINAADLYKKWEQPREYGMWQLWGDREHPATVSRDHFKLGDQRLTDGQPLVFLREFKGREEDREYYEIAQRLLHALGLHWTPERQAWCRFDEAEDIEDVINWHAGSDGPDSPARSDCIIIDREALQRYMTATDTALVQMFDSMLLPLPATSGPSEQGPDTIADRKRQRYYSFRVNEEISHYLGIQIISSRHSAASLGRTMDKRERNLTHRYEEFLVGNNSGEVVGRASCDPCGLRNPRYDTTSDKPSDMSPVFFRPHVLDKYKSNPDKYRLTPRQIHCRDKMLLQTYGINQASQVFTYIYYLGLLPHKEQRHWKLFNERPKAGISEEAFCTDFMGMPFKGPDPLRDLRHLVTTRLAGVGWYTSASAGLVDQLWLPITESKKEWSDTIGVLCKIVNERLIKRFFKSKVGLQEAKKWGSIRCLEEALFEAGANREEARKVTEPFRDLQHLRNKLVAHHGGSKTQKLYASLKRKHKSLRGHVEDLCRRLVSSLEHLEERWPASSDE